MLLALALFVCRSVARCLCLVATVKSRDKRLEYKLLRLLFLFVANSFPRQCRANGITVGRFMGTYNDMLCFVKKRLEML